MAAALFGMVTSKYLQEESRTFPTIQAWKGTHARESTSNIKGCRRGITIVPRLEIKAGANTTEGGGKRRNKSPPACDVPHGSTNHLLVLQPPRPPPGTNGPKKRHTLQQPDDPNRVNASSCQLSPYYIHEEERLAPVSPGHRDTRLPAVTDRVFVIRRHSRNDRRRFFKMNVPHVQFPGYLLRTGPPAHSFSSSGKRSAACLGTHAEHFVITN